MGNRHSLDFSHPESAYLLSMNPQNSQLGTCIVPIDDFEDELSISFGFRSALPEDIFWHIFSFLEVSELCRVCQVRSTWKQVIYSPYMWSELDLYGFRYKVSSVLLHQLITNRRFSLLRTLRLDDSRAMDISCLRVVASACPQLNHLSLLRCRQLHLEIPENFAPLQDLVFQLNRLKKLELYGCFPISDVREIFKGLKDIDPRLNLGFLQLQWSAVTGLDEIGNPHPCRLAQESNFHSRVCWGPVSGHLIYTNQNLSVHGNLPSHVLYSCVTHSDLEENLIADGEYGQCNVCSRMFSASSMADPSHCRVCHDRKALRDVNNWCLSDHESIQKFANTERTVVEIFDRKNLPKSLKFENVAASSLDDLLDPELQQFKRILAARHEDNLRIWADNENIIKGSDGQVLVDTCLALWRHAFAILYPIAAIMIILSYFARTLNVIVSEINSQQTTASSLSQSRDDSVETQQLLILAICFFATFCIVHICLRRYREQCLNLFRKVLVADFFMIFVFGSVVSLSLIVERLEIVFDLVSLGIISYNFATLNIIGLYFRGVPPNLRRFKPKFSLNCMMAIVVLLTLNSALIVTLLTVPIFFDLYAQFSRQRNIIVPLLVHRRNEDHPEGLDLELHNPMMHIQHEDEYRHINVQHDRPVLSIPTEWIPRLSYQVGDIEMRMFDFLWYGLLISLPEATVIGLATATLTGFFVIVVTIMLCPIFQLDIKSLPVAFTMILFMEGIRKYCMESFFESLVKVSLNM